MRHSSTLSSVRSFGVGLPIDLRQIPMMRVAGFFVPTKPTQRETRDGHCADRNNQKRHKTAPRLSRRKIVVNVYY